MIGNIQSIRHGIYSTLAYVFFSIGQGNNLIGVFFSSFLSLVRLIDDFYFVFRSTRWMLQFLPGHREQIVCRRDGTLRHSEPSAGENLACIVPFILIYYFLIAANVWFAIFTYAWYLQTKDRGMFSLISQFKIRPNI